MMTAAGTNTFHIVAIPISTPLKNSSFPRYRHFKVYHSGLWRAPGDEQQLMRAEEVIGIK